ncbi:hypothetical protein HMI56_002187, partial [Coelomomyces lativittatus]
KWTFKKISLVQLELDLNGETGSLPANKCRVGDIVLLQPDVGPLTSNEQSIQSTIYRITETLVTVVFSENIPDFLNASCRMSIFLLCRTPFL